MVARDLRGGNLRGGLIREQPETRRTAAGHAREANAIRTA
jgi:hypothetical protein